MLRTRRVEDEEKKKEKKKRSIVWVDRKKKKEGNVPATVGASLLVLNFKQAHRRETLFSQPGEILFGEVLDAGKQLNVLFCSQIIEENIMLAREEENQVEEQRRGQNSRTAANSPEDTHPSWIEYLTSLCESSFQR